MLKDILLILIIIIIVSYIILFINTLIIREINKATLFTNIILPFLLFFALVENEIIEFFPMLYYWHIILIIIFILSHFFILIKSKINENNAKQINLGILLLFVGLITFNAAKSLPIIINSSDKETKKETFTLSNSDDNLVASQNEDMPNVYFFIFDEYGGYLSLKRYCDFDNIKFYDSLEKLGFTTSKSSINGSIDTYTEIPNLLQLQKINTVGMTANEKKENFKDPELFKLMKSNGYEINALDSTNYKFIDSTYADYKFSQTFISTYGSFNSLIIENTVFYPFYGSNDHIKEIDNVKKMFQYASDSSEFSESNLFTIGYFYFPHFPYIIDENGNKTNNDERNDLNNPKPYLNQLKYSNKKILEMVRTIISNDNESVIVLQSDHGYRLPTHLSHWYGINKYDLEVEAEFERNILNAVYFKGQIINIDGLSGLDTLYKVLNNLLGVKYFPGD